METWIDTRIQDLRNLRRRVRVLFDRVQRELLARPEMAERLEPATVRLEESLERATTHPTITLTALLQWFGAQMDFFRYATAYLTLIMESGFVESLRRVVSALSVEESLKIQRRVLDQVASLQAATVAGYALVPDAVVAQLKSLDDVTGADLGLLVALARRATPAVRTQLEARLTAVRENILGAPPRELLASMRAAELLCVAFPSSATVGGGAKLILPDREGDVRLFRLSVLLKPPRPIAYAASLTPELVELLGSPLQVVPNQKMEINAVSNFMRTVYVGSKLGGASTNAGASTNENLSTNEGPPSTLYSVAYGEHLFAGIETRMHLPANAVWGDPTSDEWEFPRQQAGTELPNLHLLVRQNPPVDNSLFLQEAALGALLVLASGRDEGRTPRVEILNNLAAVNK